MSIGTVRRLAHAATIYIPNGCEGIRVDYVMDKEDYFAGTGEETGEEYRIEFADVDLENDMFYKLVLMENK